MSCKSNRSIASIISATASLVVTAVKDSSSLRTSPIDTNLHRPGYDSLSKAGKLSFHCTDRMPFFDPSPTWYLICDSVNMCHAGWATYSNGDWCYIRSYDAHPVCGLSKCMKATRSFMLVDSESFGTAVLQSKLSGSSSTGGGGFVCARSHSPRKRTGQDGL